MAERKKACVIHVKGDNCELTATVERLEQEGYDVHVLGVAKETASAMEAGGAVPEEVQKCLGDADVVVILLSESVATSKGVGEVLIEAQNHPARVVAVWSDSGGGAVTPQIVRDYAQTLVHSDSASFPDALCGDNEVW